MKLTPRSRVGFGRYELERLGYSVSWRAIPRSITPMNRILLAHRPARDAGETAPGAPARDEPAP